MAIKLNRTESVFRNDLIFAADAKAVKIDNTILNMCLLLKFNGTRPKARTRRKASSFIDMEKLNLVLDHLEDKGSVKGFKENREAAVMWIRTNLVNLVNRGNIEKENIASLRPIHLESYKVRNSKHARDYNSSDQVYQMLSANPQVREELKTYLGEGWDSTLKQIQGGLSLDVDSLGILHFVKEIDVSYSIPDTKLSRIKPLLLKQSKLFCDDIHRLLVYRSKIPRAVIIDYLKTITAFHLSLYTRKLIQFLPQIISSGSLEQEDKWYSIVDVTDNLESHISKLAVADAAKSYNGLFNYIKSTFQINAVINVYNLPSDNSESLIRAIQIINDPPDDFESQFQARWNLLREGHEDEDQKRMDELTEYEKSYFDKYIQILMEVRGNYQYKFYTQFLDNISLKNDERGFLAQGRSKKHPRRFVLGTKLLEAIIQLMVLKVDPEQEKFTSEELTIENLMDRIYKRYGLIINGLNHSDFIDADLDETQAFDENVDAFKQKLRKIGFYNDLSDAYILQKIKPRYDIG